MVGVHLEELNYKNKEDIRRTAELYSKVFSGHPWNEDWPLKEALKAVNSWREFEKKMNGKVFIVKKEGEIVGLTVGLAVGHILDSKEHTSELNEKLRKNKTYYLREVAVDPDIRRHGIATMLTEAREKHARQLKCDVIIGRTRFDNTSKIQQFLKGGYKPVHEEEHITGGKRSLRIYYMKKLK